MNTWQKTMHLWQVKTLLLVLVMLGLGVWAGIPVDTLAQGPASPTPTNVGGVLPTPTNVGGGGSNQGSKSSGGTPVPAGAGVSGFVYNYSTMAFEGGVPVMISGDGWSAETISDSNGYYRFDSLGTGRAVLNLRLPPGTHPVVVDWLVRTYEKADLSANLGFYWGDTPPMPVLLSANLEGEVLTVEVENFTSKTATGGVLEVETPARVKISPAVEMVQGSAGLVYDAHQSRLVLGEIAPGATVLAHLSLAGVDSAQDAVRITFTYDQQYTPQVIAGFNDLPPLASAAMSFSEGIDSGETEKGAPQAAPHPEATPASSASDGESGSEANTKEIVPEAAEPTPLSQLPTTGTGLSSDPTSLGILFLSTVIIIGLMVAGGRTFGPIILARKRQRSGSLATYQEADNIRSQQE